jgi:hypothetical protein
MLLDPSSTVHELADNKDIFDRVHFPIRYNFPQDLYTGVVTRTFSGATPQEHQRECYDANGNSADCLSYFYLINHASGKVLGISGNSCTPGTFIELQDDIRRSRMVADWKVEDALESF